MIIEAIERELQARPDPADWINRTIFIARARSGSA
jgi:hypothetical protein